MIQILTKRALKKHLTVLFQCPFVIIKKKCCIFAALNQLVNYEAIITNHLCGLGDARLGADSD
jgi:hypothetical protein